MPDQFDEWFEAQARCSLHTSRSAEITCGRCGAFRCELCVDAREPALCSECAELVVRDRIPQVTQGIAWKLVLAPAFALVSAGMLVAKHGPLPGLLAIWLVPVACAVALLRSRRPIFGWLGVLVSLAVLAWQAAGAVNESSWLMVSDVAMLAIAPLAASFGCVALARQRARLI